jgi:hypothetical protein
VNSGGSKAGLQTKPSGAISRDGLATSQGEAPQASSITVGGKLPKAFVPTAEKKQPALEKYLLENKHPAGKIAEVIQCIEALGMAAEGNEIDG